METVLFLAIAFAIAYVVIYTPVGKMLGISGEESAKNSSNSVSSHSDQLVVPEDSALKRHFFAQLRTDIESELAPRPTCSMLKRHHDALVSVEMDNRLQAAA
jgi:hypothetical protein